MYAAARDDGFDRNALHHHHPQSDHDGADEPAVRRHHGRTRRVATGLGRSRRRGEDSRSERGVATRHPEEPRRLARRLEGWAAAMPSPFEPRKGPPLRLTPCHHRSPPSPSPKTPPPPPP